MITADRRIPVTEEWWRQLRDLKRPGQTYDNLLRELVRGHGRRRLAECAREVREADKEGLASFDV